jgi:uncharacterized protein YdiU (UPF0061 family)
MRQCFDAFPIRNESAFFPAKVLLTRQARPKFVEFAATERQNNSAHRSFSLSHQAVAKMPSTHNAEKPWDTEDVDKWTVSFYQRRKERKKEEEKTNCLRLKNSNPKTTLAAPLAKNPPSRFSSPNTAKPISKHHGRW